MDWQDYARIAFATTSFLAIAPVCWYVGRSSDLWRRWTDWLQAHRLLPISGFVGFLTLGTLIGLASRDLMDADSITLQVTGVGLLALGHGGLIGGVWWSYFHARVLPAPRKRVDPQTSRGF